MSEATAYATALAAPTSSAGERAAWDAARRPPRAVVSPVTFRVVSGVGAARPVPDARPSFTARVVRWLRGGA